MKDHLALLIDTASERGMWALLQEGKVIHQVDLPLGYQNSRYLVSSLNDHFQKLNLTPRNLSYISVGNGPGSYTGIRVGVIVAKTIAFACKIPTIGVCSLLGYVPSQDGSFAALLDAKIGGFYVLMGKMKRGKITTLSHPLLCPLLELGSLLHEVNYIVTPHLASIQPKIQTLYPKQKWEWIEQSPSPVFMGEMAFQKFSTGDFNQDGKVEILYLRKTQAEIDRERS